MQDFLRSIPVFDGLSDGDLLALAAVAEEVEIPAGEILFKQGDPARAFYIVRSGTLQVFVSVPAGDEQLLATSGPGELLGEMAVLYQQPRTASVRAATAARLVKIGAEEMERLFVAHPAARARFLHLQSRRLPSFYLATVPIFAGLDPEALQELDIETNWVRIAGGQTLFHEGDPPDYLYVVVRGRLEVVIRRDDGGPDLIRQQGRGAVIGEIALLSGEPRTATVRALRDSELIRLSKQALLQLFERHPRGAIEMVRVLAGRLLQPLVRVDSDTLVSTIAVVPAGPGLSGWVERLVAALSVIGGPTLHVSRSRIDRELGGAASTLNDELSGVRVRTWLHEQEERFRYIIFDCDHAPSIWADACLRQADLVLMVVSAENDPKPSELQRRILGGETGARLARRELVLLQPASAAKPAGTARWLHAFPVARHHHVRIDRAEDDQRVARFIAGKAVSVAFSGGGARTFGYVGVVRALRESGIPIDAVCGVSAGCLVAAFCALEHHTDTMVEIIRGEVERYNPLREATLPVVAFLSSRKSVELFKRLFPVDIEDLWLPFCSVSANLSRARVVVHDRGPLWKSIRASTSVPGLMPPVCVDGELLVDGGVLNNLPADVMRNRYGGTVVALDVSLEVELTTRADDVVDVSGWRIVWSRLNPFVPKQDSIPHIFEILMRTAMLSSVHHGASIRQSSDLYIRLPVEGIATLDWAAGPPLIERCYHHALEQIAKWKAGESRP